MKHAVKDFLVSENGELFNLLKKENPYSIILPS